MRDGGIRAGNEGGEWRVVKMNKTQIFGFSACTRRVTPRCRTRRATRASAASSPSFSSSLPLCVAGTSAKAGYTIRMSLCGNHPAVEEKGTTIHAIITREVSSSH